MDNILGKFARSVIEQRKLQISVIENDFDNSLLENGNIKLENGIISIIDFSCFSVEFLNLYKEKFKFELVANFQSNAEFVCKIKDDFLANSFVRGYIDLEKELWKLIVKESNSKFSCSYTDYLKSVKLDDKQEEIYNFINAYSFVLPSLELPVDVILENSIILLELTESDAQYNLPLREVLAGIKNKSKANYKLGLELLNKVLSVSEEKENIISAIISGLYETEKIGFFESTLKDLVQSKRRLNAIFFGLSNVSEIEISDCELFVKLIKLHVKDETLVNSILSLVFTVLSSKNIKFHVF